MNWVYVFYIFGKFCVFFLFLKNYYAIYTILFFFFLKAMVCWFSMSYMKLNLSFKDMFNMEGCHFLFFIFLFLGN